MARTFLLLGSLFAFIGVAAGAFGAHILKSRLTVEMLNIFEVAVRYQMYHALALVALGLAPQQEAVWWQPYSGYSFIAGILLFSGSLYLWVWTGARWLGAVTPVGGVAFLIGWLCLVAGLWRR
ncbi:MAG: DUF423 domain-containing protein [Acidobacteria bacterium]|nr:DUF423 domain-containing protein [Acidobacteriota bacterium]